MRILLINQVFHPDTVSSAQHAADLAVELARAGHQVRILCSRRGYDSPEARFPERENWNGIEIRRVSCTGFGKGAKWRRAADYASFLLNCLGRLLLMPRQDVVVAMTTPPLVSWLAALATRLKGGRLVLWIMDLNPDQAIAAGYLSPGGVAARCLERFLRFSLRRASRIVVLDDYMRERIRRRGIPDSRIRVIAPWSHDDVAFDPVGREFFRRQHQLQDKFVVMYSGNHSPCHPLDTLLAAAAALADCPNIHFCFVGGGSEFGKVEAFRARNQLGNITCLGYQPRQSLSASLSSADLHVVVMGDPFVGIVHPCKVYNVLALGLPLLYIGPAESHIAGLLPGQAKGHWFWLARHGDGRSVAEHILAAELAPRSRSPRNSNWLRASPNARWWDGWPMRSFPRRSRFSPPNSRSSPDGKASIEPGGRQDRGCDCDREVGLRTGPDLLSAAFQDAFGGTGGETRKPDTLPGMPKCSRLRSSARHLCFPGAFFVRMAIV